jgi:hypothetical protein
MAATPFGQREQTSQRRADRAASGARVRWTEEEINQLEEPDMRILMQVATLRSFPHDLFVIRWCTARIRELQRPSRASDESFE